MDQAEFDAFMARATKAHPPAAPAAQEQQQEPTGGSILDNPQVQQAVRALSAGTQPEADPNSLAPAGTPAPLEATMTGAAKGIFETKDFLFGETPKEDRSAFRTTIEERDQQLRNKSIVDGFASGVGQFAISMIGLGKAADVAKALPWFGKGLAAATEALPKTAESVKAALAGATAFDPHEERLSNLIQDTPLANPLTAWLSAQPGDSAAEGRVKSALESIGLDATIAGVFLGSTKIWKALRSGNGAEASRLADEMQAGIEKAKEPDGQPPSSPNRSSDMGAPDGAGDGANPPKVAEEPTPAAAAEAPAPHDAPGSQADMAEAPAAPQVVANASDAADAAGTTLNSPQPRIRFSDENTEELLKGMDADAEAISANGGWYQAIEAGHTFGKGEGIPYVKLNADRDLDDFMARVVDVAQERLDRMKGGAVLSDKTVGRVADQMSSLFNADPAQVIGLIHQAGKAAPAMVANMEAGYLVANRMFQDTYALASRIRLGDYTGFGGRDAAVAELKKRASMAASVYGSARAMTAAGGRAVRRMRAEFRIDPEAVSKLQSMDGDGLVALLSETNGNPRAMAKATDPGLIAKITDWGQFLLINNLVSGPKTQLINAMTNAYMLGARPLERILGASVALVTGQASGSTNRAMKEALKQYAYIGTAFSDGFAMARKAFMLNDSVLAPHHTEAYRGNNLVQAGLQFRPWDSPGSLLHNALMVAGAGGLPTRALGFIDEAMKQTTYRSKIMAAAHVDAVEQGVQAGLKGAELATFVKTFVRDKVDAAFDNLGRATDPVALREAQVATFQQELLPGTIGKWISNGVQAHPMLRLVLPFVKTPTNVLRYGWKMSPGLNMLQSEYRDMLLGRMGMEAKLQATGQMMMGGLFMGTAAYLSSMGFLTGSGPRDPKQRQALQATGWQPYSVVHQNADGTKTYVPYSRLDPIAIPMGIITDLMDALHVNEGQATPDWEATAGALLFALSNQFTNKTYLTGVSQALDALMSADDSGPQKAANWLNTTAANFIPASAALRQLNPDPYMRDARDLTDKLMATVPGFSEEVRPKYDIWGDPVRRVGLWSSDQAQLVDTEMQRLILESGSALTPPNPVNNGVDLREITMEDGRNAFEVYQQLAGHPAPGHDLKDRVAKLIQSDAYQRAPDGDVGTRGTKLWLMHRPVDAFRTRAMLKLKRDRNVRDAFRASDLKVRQHYQQQHGTTQQDPMQKLGAAFGQDLSGLGLDTLVRPNP